MTMLIIALFAVLGLCALCLLVRDFTGVIVTGVVACFLCVVVAVAVAMGAH